jgi:trehalose 6-phosphate synthase/phosphatase
VLETAEIIKKFKEAKRKLVLLDYDGTLVNFELTPESARPTERLLTILEGLSGKKNVRLAIITGRSRESIEPFVGHLPIDIIAEHGAVMKISSNWIASPRHSAGWKTEIKKLLQKYVSDCESSFVEEKEFALCWHYRTCEEKEGWLKSRQLIAELGKMNSGFRVIDGNKVVEVAIKNIDKGIAAGWMVNQEDYDFVLSVGDDRTDEDMFSVLGEFKNCHTVKVGTGATLAKHKLVNVADVLLLLEQL